ncbi:MAG: siroheme synthase CysG [Pseudomonadota bacterium]
MPSLKHPARIERLAVLPLFAKLDGRRALVAGGSEGAAWKAELMAAAGAHVLVLTGDDAGEISGDMLRLETRVAAGELLAGSVRLERRPWTEADFAGRGGEKPTLAVLETDSETEAASFAATARDAGVVVNCVDWPVYCDVQFGAIVNRSPVVVGIATDGATPILGQAIRRKIETLLPVNLTAWAGALAECHTRLLSLLPGKDERQRFFERITEQAMRGDALTPAEDTLDTLAADAKAEHTARTAGHVTLVGAGPGDADLLTIKAVRALQAADVILFDALISADVLELARREAKRMLVGKRANRDSCRQEDINALMLKLAQQGRRVVRLKSGDPMVFGRAGEEIEALQAAGLSYNVVPGVTTASAMAASLGLSLTHRGLARSVRFVTGHGSDGRLPEDLDWRGLADPGTTLIVYMGARTSALLTERLVAEGLPAETPAIAVTNVSRANQTRWIGTLADLPLGIRELDSDEPMAIGIGKAIGRASCGTVADDEPPMIDRLAV